MIGIYCQSKQVSAIFVRQFYSSDCQLVYMCKQVTVLLRQMPLVLCTGLLSVRHVSVFLFCFAPNYGKAAAAAVFLSIVVYIW